MMPSQLRIAFVANTSWSMYKFRLPLLRALVEKGMDVYVLAPRDKYTAFFSSLKGITYIELKKLNSKSISLQDDLRLYRELLYHYRRLHPHLIFHYTIKANIYGSLAAARTGCKAVSIITGLGYMFTVKSILTSAASALYRYALRKTREVWFLNRDDQDAFVQARLVNPEKTFILPGEGVDPHIFYAAPYRDTTAPVCFLLMARLMEHKGIYEFAEASRILRSRRVPVQCCLLGFADDKSAVAIPSRQLAQWQSEGNIVFLGETDNVVPYIEKADCLVLPSYREGLPLSLLEGACMGKALIASNVPGCRELVKDGLNGFLCQPKDAVGLAETMERFCRLSPQQKKDMGNAGREMVTRHYTTTIITDIYIRKLAQLTAS